MVLCLQIKLKSMATKKHTLLDVEMAFLIRFFKETLNFLFKNEQPPLMSVKKRCEQLVDHLLNVEKSFLDLDDSWEELREDACLQIFEIRTRVSQFQELSEDDEASDREKMDFIFHMLPSVLRLVIYYKRVHNHSTQSFSKVWFALDACLGLGERKN